MKTNALVFAMASCLGSLGSAWGGTAAAKVQMSIPAASHLPALIQLGGILAASNLNVLLPGSAVPSVAAWDASRASELLQRASALDAQGVRKTAETVPTSGEEGARKILEAINAVLRDVSAEDLEKMPPDQVHAVASLIMDHVRGGNETSPATNETAVKVLADARLRRILSLRGKPLEERLIHREMKMDAPDQLKIRGVPPGISALKPTPGVILRHYTTREGLEGILSSRTLWNGLRPLMLNFGDGIQRYYLDLTGVFLTTPLIPGHVAGLPAAQYPVYVDVRLPEGMPLIDAIPEFPGHFFIIPLPARTRDWIADMYRRWARGQETSNETLREIDESGGPGPDLGVPVEIVGFGEVAR